MLKLEIGRKHCNGQQPYRDTAVELLRGFVDFDSADSSHAARLTKVRVKHLQRDMIWNTDQPCEKSCGRAGLESRVCVYKGNAMWQILTQHTESSA